MARGVAGIANSREVISMTEQFGATPPRTPQGPADTTRNPSAVRPTDISPAAISQSQQGSAMDGELSAIRTRIKRLEGKPDKNGKQWRALYALQRQEWSIINPGWRDGMDEFLDELRTTGNVESR